MTKKDLSFFLNIKVVWFTALFPYVVLAILGIRAIYLPGSVEGLEYYLTPNMSTLQNPSVWMDAASRNNFDFIFNYFNK